MTIANWCVLAAAVMPYVLTGLAKSRSDYDNAQPRRWLATVAGWRQRAHWAQLNSFEAFPPFAAGVVIAQQADAHQGVVNALALAFIVLRAVYSALYIANRSTERSIAWTLAIACTLGLFVAAAV